MRRLETVNMSIPSGSNSATENRVKLETGFYDRMQIINRGNAAPSSPVEIKITDSGGYDLVPRVSLKALEPRSAGANFYDALAPVEIKPNVNLEINLYAAANLTAGVDYQIVFWKSCDQ